MLIVSLLVLLFYLLIIKKLKYTHLLFIITFFLLGFSGLGFLLGKLSLEPKYIEFFFTHIDNTVPRNLLTLSIFTVLKYSLGGIVAFSELVLTTPPKYEFNLMLINLSKVLPFIPSPVKLLDYIEVPFKINVYTWFFNSYLDFGYIGIVLTSIILGFLGSFVNYSYKKGNNIFSIYLAVYYAVLFLSIFHDYIYSSMFPYTTFMYLFLLKKLCYRRVSQCAQ